METVRTYTEGLAVVAAVLCVAVAWWPALWPLVVASLALSVVFLVYVQGVTRSVLTGRLELTRDRAARLARVADRRARRIVDLEAGVADLEARIAELDRARVFAAIAEDMPRPYVARWPSSDLDAVLDALPPDGNVESLGVEIRVGPAGSMAPNLRADFVVGPTNFRLGMAGNEDWSAMTAARGAHVRTAGALEALRKRSRERAAQARRQGVEGRAS